MGIVGEERGTLVVRVCVWDTKDGGGGSFDGGRHRWARCRWYVTGGVSSWLGGEGPDFYSIAWSEPFCSLQPSGVRRRQGPCAVTWVYSLVARTLPRVPSPLLCPVPRPPRTHRWQTTSSSSHPAPAESATFLGLNARQGASSPHHSSRSLAPSVPLRKMAWKRTRPRTQAGPQHLHGEHSMKKFSIALRPRISWFGLFYVPHDPLLFPSHILNE